MNGLTPVPIGRRRALALLGKAGVAALIARNTGTIETARAAECVPSTPTVTEGPYWVDEKLFRSDIRTDPATGVARPGIPLALSITLQNLSGGSCVPLAGAVVDIWQCDAIGLYSDEPAYNPGGGTGTVVTSGQKFLRGYQISDDNGQVQFLTIYPGWYGGRTIHIHVRVRTYSGATLLDQFVTQLFFDDSVSNAVLAQAPYNTRTSARDTTNSNDMVYRGAANASRMLLALARTDSGYSGAITIGVNIKTATLSLAAIASDGVGNAASGAPGVSPGSWVSIFGTGLAAAARTAANSDLVNNYLPATLGGVSVQIGGEAAFMYYVSPAQVNVLAPAAPNSGSVPVTVTNSAGTSMAAVAALQPILPGLFTQSNYVSAGALKPGDPLELYGTGFGPTATAVDPGLMFTGAYPTANPVTVTIGGVPAAVSFAGLVSAGIYQINVTVPAGLADGDLPVIAAVGGYTSQSSALLKIVSS